MNTFEVLLQEYLDGQETPIHDWIIDHAERLDQIDQIVSEARDHLQQRVDGISKELFDYRQEYDDGLLNETFWEMQHTRLKNSWDLYYQRLRRANKLIDALNGVPDVTPF